MNLRLRPVARRVRSIGRRLRTETLEEGALTDHLIAKYCGGRGLEIGPGASAYGPQGRTILVDRYLRFGPFENLVDVQADASALPFAEQFDFVISSHCLEHQPNVLSALDEWMRVLKPGGHLFLILPHADRTFDRGRRRSDYAHHAAEIHHVADPDEPLHWDEWEQWLDRNAGPEHSWTLQPEARSGTGWNSRWIAEQGLIHYHCWTQAEMSEILVQHGARVHAVIEQLPERADSFLIVARKAEATQQDGGRHGEQHTGS